MATLGFAAWLLYDFQTGVRTFQFVEENRWFDALGVGYIVGVDGFSIFMVSITALLFPIGLLAVGASRTTGSRPTRSGSCCSRASSWGSSSPST